MAHPSDVELTPGRQTAQAQGRKGSSGTESRDAGGAQTASPLKGIFGGIASRIFGRPAQSTAKEADETENAEDADVDSPIQEDDEPSDVSPFPKSTSNVPEVQIPSRKRPAERDIYKVPSSPHGSDGEAEIRVNNPRKRTKMTIKPKKAIIAPKRSKGYSSAVSALPSNTESTSRPDEHTAIPLSSPAEVEQRGFKESLPQVKRKRGRPPKNRPKEPNPTPSIQVPEDVPPAPAEAYNLEDVPPTDEGVTPQEDPEGVTEILINPSPVKPITIKRIPQTNGIATNGGQKNSKSPASGKQRNSVDRKFDDLEDGNIQTENSEEEYEDEDENEDDRGDQDNQEYDKPDQQTSNLIFQVGLLANMVNVASRVGHRYDKKTGIFDFVTDEKMMSANGKQIIRPINKLLSAYENLRIANNSEDIEAAKKAKTAAQRAVQDIKLETESILTKRLGNPSLGIEFFGEIKTRTMLQDLYFNIVPALVNVIKVAADLYQPERSMMKTFAVRQILDLVTMLEGLAKTAELQPKNYQPRPPSKSKSKTYQILRPTQLLMPDIRTIRKALSAELSKRKRADDAAAHQERLSELKKMEREKEQRRDAELETRLKDKHREQAEAFGELLAKPLWGRLLIDQIAEMEGNPTRRRDPFSMNRNVRGNRSQSVEYVEEDQDDYDPFAEEEDVFDQVDDDVDRISVFGRNNTNERSRPLSAKDKEIFVECMIRERGDDRYEKAADALDRSMDEIFSYAKDLQEAMDRKHEEGLFNKPKDDWTYDVWVATA